MLLSAIEKLKILHSYYILYSAKNTKKNLEIYKL